MEPVVCMDAVFLAWMRPRTLALLPMVIGASACAASWGFRAPLPAGPDDGGVDGRVGEGGTGPVLEADGATVIVLADGRVEAVPDAGMFAPPVDCDAGVDEANGVFVAPTGA